MDFDAFITHQSALLGLPIAAAHRPGVKRFVELAAGMAEQVMGQPLTSLDEAGSVFTPVVYTPVEPEDLAP
jgi:hypothetical protein